MEEIIKIQSNTISMLTAITENQIETIGKLQTLVKTYNEALELRGYYIDIYQKQIKALTEALEDVQSHIDNNLIDLESSGYLKDVINNVLDAAK